MLQQLRSLVPVPPDKDLGREAVKQQDTGWAMLGLGSHGKEIDKVDDKGVRKIWYFDEVDRQKYLTRFSSDGSLMKFYKENVVVRADLPVTSAANVANERPMRFNERKKDKILALLNAKGQEGGENAVVAMSKVEAIENMHAQDLFHPNNAGLLQEAKAIISIDIWKKGMQAVKDALAQEEKDWGAGPRIFVMDGNGYFYVGTASNGKFHHSSFLSGGPIAAAGEIVVAQEGKIKMISNVSGHYKPGAAFLWQAVQQLKHSLPLKDFNEIVVDIVNAGRVNAREFLQNFNPLETDVKSEHYLSFDPEVAARGVRAYILKHPGIQGGKK